MSNNPVGPNTSYARAKAASSEEKTIEIPVHGGGLIAAMLWHAAVNKWTEGYHALTRMSDAEAQLVRARQELAVAVGGWDTVDARIEIEKLGVLTQLEEARLKHLNAQASHQERRHEIRVQRLSRRSNIQQTLARNAMDTASARANRDQAKAAEKGAAALLKAVTQHFDTIVERKGQVETDRVIADAIDLYKKLHQAGKEMGFTDTPTEPPPAGELRIDDKLIDKRGRSGHSHSENDELFFKVCVAVREYCVSKNRPLPGSKAEWKTIAEFLQGDERISQDAYDAFVTTCQYELSDVS